jgi:lia operon protein LiaG
MLRFLTCPVLLLVPLVTAAAQQGERYTLDAGPVAIYNLVGQLRVEPGTDGITVQVTRGGSDAAQLKIAQGQIAGRSTLRVIYPSDRIRGIERDGHSSTQLRVRDDGTFGDYDGDDHNHHDRHSWDEGRRVRIGEGGDALDARADLVVRVPKGARAAVHLAVGSVTVSNVDGRLSVDASSAPVTASGTRGELSVDVGAGEVRISQAQGDVDVDTGSGTVEVTGFQGTALSIDTGSGDVTGSDLTTDELSIETGSGEIRLSAVASPRLSLETGSGSVTADLRKDLASLQVETGSGDVAIRAPASLGATVAIETSSGDIESDFPLEVTRHARDHVEGTIGDGQGSIAIETGSGAIKLLKAN